MFTTQTIAMLFGRLAHNPTRLEQIAGVSVNEILQAEDNLFQPLRLAQLIFGRCAQIMYRFEKALFENPEQDLNTLWWQLVEKYQLLRKPNGRNKPDWASKIHLTLYPTYYHNYRMGELLASQLHAYIFLESKDLHREAYIGRVEVGTCLIHNIFNPDVLSRGMI